MKHVWMCLFMSLFSWGLFAQEDQNAFAPHREGKSNYITDKDVQRAQKNFKGKEAEVIIKGKKLLLSQNADSSYEYLAQGLEEVFGSNVPYMHQSGLVLLRNANLIDDAFYRLMKDYYDELNYVPNDSSFDRPLGPGLALKDYITKKLALKKLYAKTSKVPTEVVLPSLPSALPIKQFKVSVNGRYNLTTKERLLYLYTPEQMKEMARIMDLALSIADAKSITTTIEFRQVTPPMVITHTPTDQYRLALRLMRIEKSESENNSLRLGTPVSDLDLITSAYELGIISYDEISLIANNKDFYSPEVSFARKVVNYLGGLAGLAFRVHPATAPYAIIPMMLYNSYQEMKNAENKIDEDSFIFSLPTRH